MSQIGDLCAVLRGAEYVPSPLHSYHAAKAALNAARGKRTPAEQLAIVRKALQRHRVTVVLAEDAVRVSRTDTGAEFLIFQKVKHVMAFRAVSAQIQTTARERPSQTERADLLSDTARTANLTRLSVLAMPHIASNPELAKTMRQIDAGQVKWPLLIERALAIEGLHENVLLLLPAIATDVRDGIGIGPIMVAGIKNRVARYHGVRLSVSPRPRFKRVL